MGLSVGIVGLPNVGKSTLFNALLRKQQALAANYPFATVEPNVGVVPVYDGRLDALARVVMHSKMHGIQSGSKEAGPVLVNPDGNNEGFGHDDLPPRIPAVVEFVDIAGLVAGAHKGEGLGNRFLSHIREVTLVAFVIRAFDDANVFVTGSQDVLEDYRTVEMELVMKDLDTVERHLAGKQARQMDASRRSTLDYLHEGLSKGLPANQVLVGDQLAQIRDLFLLSAKPAIYVLNVNEADLERVDLLREQYAERLRVELESVVVVCAKMEDELSALDEVERKQYLSELGIAEDGLELLVRTAYEKLGLISFLTAGEKEVRAWTIHNGQTAQEAAGVIHTDFAKHFISADVISFEDFVQYGGWKRAREAGKVRNEGRDYLVKDGEVIEFKIGR